MKKQRIQNYFKDTFNVLKIRKMKNLFLYFMNFQPKIKIFLKIKRFKNIYKIK